MIGLFSKLFAPKTQAVQNSFVKVPVFHETLSFPLPESWPIEPALRTLEGGTFVLEFVGEGQSAEAWQDKLIVQGFNNANDDIELNARKLLKMMRDEMAAIDAEAFYTEELFSETHITRQRIAAVMGLRSLPDNRELSQFGLYLVLEGKHDLYIVQRAWKGKPNKDGFAVSKEELLLWLEDFKQVALSPNETGAA